MWLYRLEVLSQTAPDPSPWMQLGVAGITVGFAIWIILLLLKMLREKDRLIEEQRQEIRDLTRDQMGLAERALPSLNDAARVVAEAVDELKQSRRR